MIKFTKGVGENRTAKYEPKIGALKLSEGRKRTLGCSSIANTRRNYTIHVERHRHGIEVIIKRVNRIGLIKRKILYTIGIYADAT